MGTAALALAALGLGLLPIAHLGKYLTLGLCLLGVGLGVLGFRPRATDGAARGPRQRLAAAGGVALGAIGVLLSGLKIVLTLVAIHRLARLVGG